MNFGGPENDRLRSLRYLLVISDGLIWKGSLSGDTNIAKNIWKENFDSGKNGPPSRKCSNGFISSGRQYV